MVSTAARPAWSRQDRFTCTQQVALDRITAAPASIGTPVVTCLKVGNDPSTTQSAANCRAGYLLTVTVATKAAPANQRFQFFTPVIGQIIGSPVITGQASVVVQ